ncbi:MAG: 50S ribosomal protein L35 [Bdellovibrionota bacterium]|jgi:large subunit ribosomal protein L35
MPKIKTNRLAHKKYRVNPNGFVKRKQANKSHNTAKKTPKRKRNLRGWVAVQKADKGAVKRLLPYAW